MTCIVGVEHDGAVTIGGDSIGIAAGMRIVREDRKVWASGQWVFGVCGSFRMAQLLRYGVDTRQLAPGPDVDRFMVGKFVDHVRDVFDNGGWLAHNQAGQHTGGTFLVGYRDRLYTMHADFQIERPVVNYQAIGSAHEVALGAMFAADPDRHVRDRIKTALAAAAYHRTDVAAPFHLVSTRSAVARARQQSVTPMTDTR